MIMHAPEEVGAPVPAVLTGERTLVGHLPERTLDVGEAHAIGRGDDVEDAQGLGGGVYHVFDLTKIDCQLSLPTF